MAARGEGCWLGFPSLRSWSTPFYNSQFAKSLLVSTFEPTGSVPGLGGDGEVGHVTDGGEGFPPESIRCDAFKVTKLPQLACGEPLRISLCTSMFYFVTKTQLLGNLSATMAKSSFLIPVPLSWIWSSFRPPPRTVTFTCDNTLDGPFRLGTA